MRSNPVSLAVCCALLLFPLAPLQAAEAPLREISVSGEAQSAMAPDMAIVELAVVREAETARAALDANSEALAQVLKAMRAAGIEERDLQTANFSIQPRYVYPQSRDDTPPKLVGYTVRNGLTVRVRKLDELGAIIDQSVSLGVNEGGNVQFTNEDPSVALDAARALAVKDALGRARTLAKAAGVTLGDILSISEHSSSPMPKMARLESSRMAMAEAAMPVAAGENAYHVNVSLRIAIE
ncbi:SIMPL domain-containing protein [Haliea sp. E17]|uniref:SIMPL domain-containing protein n=1 Tax=Haliea sp. E17 TaxID=3401576 RepID=UPI003AAD2094